MPCQNAKNAGDVSLETGGMYASYRQLVIGQTGQQAQRHLTTGTQTGQQLVHRTLAQLGYLPLVPVIQREAFWQILAGQKPIHGGLQAALRNRHMGQHVVDIPKWVFGGVQCLVRADLRRDGHEIVAAG